MNLIRKNISYDLFQLYLVCLIPFGLVFSRFVADFSLVVVGLIFIFKNYKINKSFLFKDNFVKFFLFFWIIICIRSLFAEDVFFSLKSSFFYIRFMLFALAIKFLFETNKKYLYYFFCSLTVCLAIVIFDGFVQFIFKKNILGYPAIVFDQSYRLSGLFKDELIIGSFISRVLPLYLGLYMYCKYLKVIRDFDSYVLIFLFLSSLLVIFSGERVAIFYVSLTVFFGLISINFFNFKAYFKIFIVFFLVMIVLTVHDGTRKRLITKTFEQIGFIDSKKEGTVSTKNYMYSIHHHNHIIAAYKIFRENMLFGSGVKMFRKICDKRHKVNEYACTTHPHNTIMQFLSETGLIGFSFYLMTLIYVLKILILKIKFNLRNFEDNLNKSKMFYMIAIFIPLMPFLPSANFFNNWVSILNFLPVGFYLLANIKKNEY